MNDSHIFWFINQHFVADYYYNNGEILESIINMIQYLREHQYDRILEILNSNKNNIVLYVNKEKIVENFDLFEIFK
jgi:ADP-heptose:LPS heptosyltransferase